MLSSRAILVFLIKLNIPVLGVEDYFYVGCYSPVGNFSQKYSGSRGFWVDCINLCYERETDYAGINAQQCYCGNEIINIFLPVSKTECEVCLHDEGFDNYDTRYCGGFNDLSVYKILPTSASSTAILLAIDTNLKKWGLENNTKMWWALQDTKIAFVVYNPVTLDIYYVSENTVYWLENYYPLHRHSFDSKIVVKSGCNDIVGLAVDWKNDLIFWACQDRIHWRSFKTNGRFHIHLEGVQNFVVEPYRTFVLLTNTTDLVKYNYITNKTDIMMSKSIMSRTKSKMFFVILTALDIQQERIYLICSFDGEKQLVVMDYDGATWKNVVVSSDKLSDPFGIDVVNGTIVWGNKKNTGYTLYKSQVSCSNTDKTCDLVNVAILLTQSDKINDFKMYTREAKLPSLNYLCERKKCSQMCYRLSAYEVGCRCPDNLDLDQDGRTCVEKSPTTALPVPLRTSNNPYESQIITTPFLKMTRTSTEPLTSPSPLVSSTETGKTTFSLTASTSEIEWKEHGSCQGTQYAQSFIILTTTAICIMNFIIIVIFFICMTIRLQKINRILLDGHQS